MIATVVLVWLLAGAAPQAANDVAAAEARTLYVEAKNAYDGGRFDDALVGFQAAFAKKPLPGFLFNLGQCERQLGHHERAIFFFERYLDEKPDAANRATVEELIAESRVQLAAAPTPTSTPTPTATPTPTTPLTPGVSGAAAAPSINTDDGGDFGVWPVVVATAAAVTVGVAVGVGVALAVTSSRASLGTHEVIP